MTTTWGKPEGETSEQTAEVHRRWFEKNQAMRRDRWQERAKVPTRFHHFSALDLPAGVRTEVQGFIDGCVAGTDGGVGLLFYGPPGSGKTTAATVALREVLARASMDWLGRTPGLGAPIQPGRFISYADLIALQQRAFRSDDRGEAAQEIVDSLFLDEADNANVKILALDDVGKEHSGGSGFTVNVFHRLIRTRFDAAAPTIITTNIYPDAWADGYGEATASFLSEAFLTIPMVGRDRRRGR